MINIAIAEVSPRLASALKVKIESIPTYYNAEIVTNGTALLDALKKGKQVDVLFVDSELPSTERVYAVEKISHQFPQVKIIVTAGSIDDPHLFQSILAGAKGFILKDVNSLKIHSYIQELMAGGAPMNPVIAKKSLELIRSKEHNVFKYSALEELILQQLASASDYQKLARALNMTEENLKIQVDNIYQKLHFNTKLETIKEVF